MKKYKKHTRPQTEEEKQAFRSIRYALRQGMTVRVSFNIKGTKNKDGLAAVTPHEPVDADGKVPYVEPTWEELRARK